MFPLSCNWDQLFSPVCKKTNKTTSNAIFCYNYVNSNLQWVQVNVTLEKEVTGFWVKVPCVDELGSCHYSDACQILDTLTPPGQDCPEPLHTYGIPCRCPFKAVNVTLEKEVTGFWVKVPCVDELGSCHYSDACQILDTLTPPGQDCPEPLHTYGIPCRCPFKAGDYSLPDSDFYLPNVDLPYWLTNGNYKVVGVLGSAGQELGCLKLTFSLHST
ncbi:UNVERIFIED_CONTAM: hypothetical protein FKN15_073557 [Acipenser sinensis]